MISLNCDETSKLLFFEGLRVAKEFLLKVIYILYTSQITDKILYERSKMSKRQKIFPKMAFAFHDCHATLHCKVA